MRKPGAVNRSRERYGSKRDDAYKKGAVFAHRIRLRI
jgi:hypothetical protein